MHRKSRIDLAVPRPGLPGKLVSIACVAAFFLFACEGARAQGVGASGELNGRVTDQNNAAIVAAKIVATASETGLKRTAITNESGEYRFPNLAPATYDVSASFQGFEPAFK